MGVRGHFRKGNVIEFVIVTQNELTELTKVRSVGFVSQVTAGSGKPAD